MRDIDSQSIKSLLAVTRSRIIREYHLSDEDVLVVMYAKLGDEQYDSVKVKADKEGLKIDAWDGKVVLGYSK